MKIRLLDNSGYHGMDNVNFPEEVEAEPSRYGNVLVHETEMARIGCDMDCFEDPDDPVWPFSPGSWEAAE